MTLLILGLITAIYTFAKKGVQKEPLKGKIEQLINSTNQKLIKFKDEETKDVLLSIRRFCIKTFIGTIITFYIAALLPIEIAKILFDFITPIFGISVLLVSAVDWVQNHKKTFKEYFFNWSSLILFLAPTIGYLMHLFVKSNPELPNVFGFFYDNINYVYLLIFQIAWIPIIFIFIYLGTIIFIYPIYYLIYLLIKLTAYYIKLVQKKFNDNILNFIIYSIPIAVMIVKIVMELL